jgi:hypothetical protein
MDGFVVNEDGVIADTIQEKLDTGIITDDTLVLEDADKKARDEEERKKSERKPSMVKLPGRDEYLLLPDRESVLRFEPIDDFAVETDVETQNAQVSTHTHRKKKKTWNYKDPLTRPRPPTPLLQREASWWGRLYVENFPLSFQYVRRERRRCCCHPKAAAQLCCRPALLPPCSASALLCSASAGPRVYAPAAVAGALHCSFLHR